MNSLTLLLLLYCHARLLSTTQPLFLWDALDDSPTRATLKHVLATIPDQPLLDSRRRHRGHGRDDCPLHVLWEGLLLTIVLRHQNFAACLAELTRNDDLRMLIGLLRDASGLERLPLPGRTRPTAPSRTPAEPMGCRAQGGCVRRP